MCCVVLECIECSASAMWIWWSCNEYVLQYLFDYRCKNGNEINKIYCTVKHGSNGLVMKQKCAKIQVFNSKKGKLNGIMLFNSSCILSVCKIEMFLS